jgi:MFS transporter, DHA1 family, multidrug resistance protein
MPQRRRIFLSLFLAVFISSLGLGILSPILPVYFTRFAGSSTFLIGVIVASYSASRTLFMPPVGYLCDRMDKRGFIIAGLALFTVTSLLYVAARDPLSLIAVRFVQGIAAAMLMPVAMAIIGEITPHGREGFVMGAFNTAFFAGLGFGPLIGGVLMDAFSVQAAFYGMGATSALALVLALLTLPPSAKAGPKDGAGGERGSGRGRPMLDLSLLFNRQMGGIILFRFTRSLGIGLLWMFLPLYAAVGLGMNAFHVGVLLSANTVLSTFLQAPFGHLSDKVGHHRCIAWGSFVWTGGMAAIPFVDTFVGLLALSVLLGLSGALSLPAGNAQALHIGRKRGIGAVMGLYNGALSLGTLIGPLAGGLMADWWGMRSVFFFGAAAGLLGWAGYHRLYVRGGEEEEPFFVNLEAS